jgi:hypothetical protein
MDLIPKADEHEFHELPGTRSTVPQSKRSKFTIKSKPLRRTLICCSIFAVSLAIFVPIGLYVIAPSMAQSTLDDSAIILMNATMSDPTVNTVRMNTFLEMSVPPVSFLKPRLKGSILNVGSEGVAFGYMQMPDIEVTDSQLWVNVSTTVYVTDVDRFTAATASVLQGRPRPWVSDFFFIKCFLNPNQNLNFQHLLTFELLSSRKSWASPKSK